MATSGTINVSLNSTITYRASWVITEQSIENNTSSVSVTHSLINGGSSPFLSNATFVAAARMGSSDSTHSISKSSPNIPAGGSLTIGTTKHVITHNDDGTLTATLSVSMTYGSTNRMGSRSIVFPSILRRSTITVPDGYAGSAITITINKAADSLKHTLSYEFGSMSGTIVENTSASTVQFTLPKTMLNEFPNASHMTGHMTCVTYSGDTEAGSYTSDFEVYVANTAEYQPDLTVTLQPSHSLPAAFNNVYVQTISKVSASITATGKYGATITDRKLTVESKSYGSPFLSDALAGHGSISVVCTATDSRGCVATVTNTIIVQSYAKPAIVNSPVYNDVICKRCDADGTISSAGTSLRIACGLSFSSVGGLNEARLNYRIGNGSWAEIPTDSIISNAVPLISQSYSVSLKVTDRISSSTVMIVSIPTDTPTLHLRQGGKGAAFGKYAEEDDILDVNFRAKFRKGATGLQASALSGNSGDISSGANFNDFKTCGIYRCHETNCTNQPAATSGTLIVRTGEADDEKTLSGTWIYLQQIYIPRTPNAIYMRHMIVWGTAGTWEYGKWYKFAGTQI